MKKNIASRSRINRREIERRIASVKKINKKDLKEILYKMKYNLNNDVSKSIIDPLDSDSKNFLLGCPLPNSYNLLRTIGTASFKYSFHHEINWSVLSLSYFHEDINHFLTYEKEFESAFLLGNYKLAKEILDKVDSEICVSFWSIEKRFLLAEYSKEEGQQKNELINTIKNNAERLIKINALYLNVRFEAQLPPNRYDEILNKFALNQKQSGISEYFLFRLNFYNFPIIERPELALYLESNLSIIDRYQIFIQVVLSSLCTKNPNISNIDSIKPCISVLSNLINDQRLININIYLGNENANASINLNSFVGIIEKFNNNSFQDCYDDCLSELKAKPYLIEVAELLAKCSLILNKACPRLSKDDSIINSILENLYNVFSKNSDYDGSLYNLNKIAKSIGSPIWCNRIVEILNEEQSVVNDIYDYNLHRILAFTDISYELPLYLKETSQIESLLNIYRNSKCFVSSIFWQPIVQKELTPFPVGKGLFMDLNNVKACEFNNDYEKASVLIDAIYSHESYLELINIPFIQLELTKKRILIYSELGRTIDALELLCRSIILNPKFILALNNSKLQSLALSSDDIEIQKNICTPIIARTYKEKINDIWIAYDNFMYHNEFTFPRDLFENSFYDSVFLVFFFRYVCIQDIYDSSPSFTSPENLDDERIAICNHLCILDADNKESYVNEISETETKALIKKGIKEIDESKIYVDTAGIWREIEGNVKERFTRGRELLKLDKEEIDYLLEMSSSVLILLVSKEDKDGNLIKFDNTANREKGIINLPHFENFKETFLLIRDRFISSNEFGLDSYISMRIRHGTLLGQIRSIFERYNLITKKDGNTKQYVLNEYWIDKLNVNEINKHSISEKLNVFSEKTDQMSEQIKNSFLQIKTEEKSSDGLFDYKFDDKELVSFYEKEFYPLDNHTAFFEVAVNLLWVRTEKDLNIIREKFKNEYCQSALGNLEELFTSVEGTKKTNSQIDTSEFLRVITACKTDTTNAFEKISLWFRRSYSNSINEFDIKFVVDICFSIVNKIHPQTPILMPQITLDTNVVFHGQYFAFFIDIMRNILDNVIVRSELNEPELKLSLNVKEENRQLKISIENNVSSSLDLDSANQKIATTQYRVDNTAGQTLVKQEGGSGYLKIMNILKVGLKRKNYTLRLEPIKQDRIFRSYISFELNDLIKT